MPKYLRQVNFNCTPKLYEEYEEYFSKIIKYLSNIYEFYVCPILNNESVSKIILLITDEMEENIKVEPECGWVMGMFVRFDKSIFDNLNNEEKLEYIQNLCFKGIEFVIESKNWADIKIIKEKHNLLLSKQLLFADYFKKKKSSKNRKLKAQFYFEYNYQSNGAYISVADKEKEFKILFAPTAYHFFCGGIKTFIWINNEEIKVIYHNNRDYWIINVVSGKVDFYYPRIEKGDAHSFYDLALIYLGESFALTFKDKEKAIYYLKKSAELNNKRAIRKLKEITDAN